MFRHGEDSPETLPQKGQECKIIEKLKNLIEACDLQTRAVCYKRFTHFITIP
ncbi:MAG TPA: hypothetical protein VMS35_01590 [Nitrososphaeraceae archaeon]|nr:hypothetical protein [Nitrososphaeraceae archaeon]